MKKKLLMLLMTMCMVIPLTACDEDSTSEEVGTTNISVELVKGNSEGVDINLNDCARIINGPGTYESGSIANVSVEYYPSACKFHHVVDNADINTSYTPSNSTNNKKLLSFNVSNLQPNIHRTIQIVFTGIDGSVDQYKVSLDRFDYIKSDDTTTSLGQDQFAFPYKTLTNPYASGTNKYSEVELKTDYPKTQNVTTETSMSTIFANAELNLNYVYLDIDKNGVFEFSPYKVKWKAGQKDVDEGICKNMQDIDINTFRVTEGEKNTCLRARIEESDANSLNESQNTAVENLVNSEIYVSTKSDAECNSAVAAGVSVSADCMYVMRLKSLYNVENTTDSLLDKGAYYYGINSSGKLEGVTTVNNGVEIQKKYLLCKSPLSELGTCSTDNALWNTYEYLATAISENTNSSRNSSYKDLAIASFIDILGTNNIYSEGAVFDKTTYNLTGLDVKYDYNHFIGDIVPVKIANYYIRYINKGDGNPTYNPINVKFSNALSEHPSNKYTLKINTLENEGNDPAITEVNTAIAALKSQVESNKLNLMEANNEAMIEALRLNIFSLIYAENSTSAKLAGYKFDIKVNETEVVVGEVTITNRELEVTLQEANIAIDSDKLFVRIGEDSYCAIENTECISDKNATDLFTKVSTLTSATNIKTLKFKNIKPAIVNEKDAIEFTIDDPTLGEIIITYCEGVFSDSSTSIEYIKGTQLDKLNIQSISSQVDVFGKDFVQTAIIYETGMGEIKITFAGEVTEFDSAEFDKITEVYNMFYNNDGTIKGIFYDMDDDEIVDSFFVNEGSVIYALEYDQEKGMVSYKNDKYDFLMLMGEYRLPILAGYEENVNFVKLGNKVCSREQTECDATYDTLLGYTDKLISKDAIIELEFVSISEDEDGKYTFKIYRPGTNKETIDEVVYDPTTREFVCEEQKVVYYVSSETTNELEFVQIQHSTTVTVAVPGEPPTEVTLDVLQKLELDGTDKYKINAYDSSKEATDPDYKLDSGIADVTKITEVFKIFYKIKEENGLDGASSAKWYEDVTLEYKIIENEGKFYQLVEVGGTVYTLIDEDGEEFTIQLNAPTPPPAEPTE